MKRRRERGFTLLEAVVAIAVVLLVSGAALTLALSSVRAEERALRLDEISILSENAVECYRAAGNDAVAFTALIEASGNGAVTLTGQTVTLQRRGYTVEMTLGSSLTIVGLDAEGEPFYTLSYPG